MSTWFVRVADRLGQLFDPHAGRWNPPSRDWAHLDADRRRQRADLDAIRVRCTDDR